MKEVGPEVLDVVFNPLAAAQVVLDQNQKSLGALVVDMGGGTTDLHRLCRWRGEAERLRSPIGGDHITNDISLGLRIPMAKAEKLKVEEGSVILGNSLPGETCRAQGRDRFCRQGDRARDAEHDHPLPRARDVRAAEAANSTRRTTSHFLGAGMMLTGGCSLLKGIDQLAEEIFGMPVHAHARADRLRPHVGL